eukprot:scaffold10116_cov127-Cylindrotheca_fusiformis.AAC.4
MLEGEYIGVPHPKWRVYYWREIIVQWQTGQDMQDDMLMLDIFRVFADGFPQRHRMHSIDFFSWFDEPACDQNVPTVFSHLQNGCWLLVTTSSC